MKWLLLFKIEHKKGILIDYSYGNQVKLQENHVMWVNANIYINIYSVQIHLSTIDSMKLSLFIIYNNANNNNIIIIINIIITISLD